MDGTLNKPATSVVDTAILLASSGVFSLSTPQKDSGPGALAYVGGLTVFQRAVLTLQRAGISQIWILAGEEEPTLRRLIQGDPRIQAALRWLPVREFPPTDPQTWEALAGEVKGSCLIVGGHVVFSPYLIQALRMVGADGRVLVVVDEHGVGEYSGNPGVVVREDVTCSGGGAMVVFHDQRDGFAVPSSRAAEKMSVAGDLVVLPSRLLGVSGVLQTPGTNPIRLALEQAAIEGIIQPVSSTVSQLRDIRGPNGSRLAERTLLHALPTLNTGFQGFIDRYFNRRCSAILTRWFLKCRLSPNAITVLSMVIGLVSAGFFVSGSYELGIIGALLFQLSVIIDCCDGEVARLTFSESRFGQELDLLADNVVHMAIFAGIASGAYLQGPWQETSLPLVLGVMTVLANMLSLWLVNQAKGIRSRPVDWRGLREKERTRIDFLLANVASRDFSVVVLLFACLDILEWFLCLAVAGSWFFVATIGWTLRRLLFSPRA